MSELLRCNGIPVAVKCPSVSEQVVPIQLPNLHVAAMLARSGGDPKLGADRVSSRAEERAKHGDHPIVRLGCTWQISARACVVAVKVHAVFFEAAFSKWAIIVAGEKALPETELPEGGTLIKHSLHTHCRLCAPGCSACGFWQRAAASVATLYSASLSLFLSRPSISLPSPWQGEGELGGAGWARAGVLERVLARTRTNRQRARPSCSILPRS